MRTSTPSNGWPQLPRSSGGQVDVEPGAAVGPERLGHAEQVRPGARVRVAGRAAARRAGCRRRGWRGRRRRSRGCGGEPGGLVGPAPEQRGPLALEEGQRRRPAPASASVSSVAPATSTVSRPAAEPAHPEERHRDVEALAGADAAGVESRARPPGGRRRGCGSTPFGRAAAARGEQDGEVVGRRGRRRRARRPVRRRRRRSGRASSDQTARRFGSRGWRRPERGRVGDARARSRRARRGSAGRGTRVRRSGA